MHSRAAEAVFDFYGAKLIVLSDYHNFYRLFS